MAITERHEGGDNDIGSARIRRIVPTICRHAQVLGGHEKILILFSGQRGQNVLSDCIDQCNERGKGLMGTSVERAQPSFAKVGKASVDELNHGAGRDLGHGNVLVGLTFPNELHASAT